MIPLMMFAACAQKESVPAIDLTDFDNNVSPKEDFFRYANGGWMEKNPLKPEYARYGAFDALAEKTEEQLKVLFTDMLTLKTVPGSVEQKISDLYKMGLDSTRLNAEGCAPLKKYVEEVFAVTDKSELARLIARIHLSGESAFFNMGVDADLMDSDNQILYLQQGGLGLRNRDYYLDPANAELKAGYQQYLKNIFDISAFTDRGEDASQNTMNVEQKLAEVSWSSVENRDYSKQYNPMSTADIIAAYPGFDFASYFEETGLPAQEKIVVNQLSFFEGFSKIFAEASIDELKDYVAAHLISGGASSLGDDLYAAYFEFFSHQMSGITEQKPRWKRAMGVPNAMLGEAVGQMYVAKYFPESSKAKMKEIVDKLKESLGQHISELEWMGEDTKAYALDKLASFTVKIGYPDKWKEYNFEVNPELSYYENLREAGKWYVADNLSKINKPVDRTEWGMSPQTVNAYYNPTTNEICFPAAILQPPFFNPDADDAVNYGAIGVVIGHEMTHGFDDQGRLFDKSGNMTNWWTEEDDAAFKEKAEVLAAQYDAVEIIPGSGVFANGHLSLGENIADHGGVSVAYTAMLNSFGETHPEPIDGFTAEQRFFLGFARVWAGNITDAEKLRRTQMDVHSLSENRVNMTLRNFDTFFEAFDIQEGDPMFRPESERVHIW